MADDPLKGFEAYMKMLNWSPSLRQRMMHDMSEAPLPSDALPATPAFDLDAANAHLERLWEAYPWRDEEVCMTHYENFLPTCLPGGVPDGIFREFCRFFYGLMQLNHVYVPPKPVVSNQIEYRDWCIRLGPRFITDAEGALRTLVSEFVELLPPVAFQESAPGSITLPLHDFMRHPKYVPSWMSVRTYNLQSQDVPVFDKTHWALWDRILEANGLTRETHRSGKHKLVYAVDAPGTSQEVLDRYLNKKSYLYELLNKPVPLSIPLDTFARHGVIIAPPGHGKTQLLSAFIADFLPDPEVGIVVLDPHGDLFAALKEMVPRERLVLLDPSTDPPPLNVFDFGSANEVQILQAFSYLMAALTGGMSEKQAAIIPYLLKLIRVIPGATVQTLLEIVTERLGKNDVSKFMPYVQQLPDIDRDFFRHQFFGKMQETKDAIAWKLSAALSYDAFRKMFTAPRNSFDAFAAMQESKIVLVKGSESVLGEYGLPVFLQFIVAQFFLAALQRDQVAETDRKLCILFADEASHVFNSQTTRILTECRKYRLGFMAATQVIQQIPQDVKAAIYGATAIKIAGPVSHTDAMLLAREMHTTAEDIRSLKSYEKSHAEWMMYISNITDHAMKVSVKFGALDRMDGAAAQPRFEPDADVIITPPPAKDACPFQVGDLIQVTLGGYDQYPAGVRVEKIDIDAGFLFVQDSLSGVPIKDCYPFKPQSPAPDQDDDIVW